MGAQAKARQLERDDQVGSKPHYGTDTVGKHEMEQAERQKTLKAVLHYFYHDNTRSGSYCRYSLQYHLVWIPKYRPSVSLSFHFHFMPDDFHFMPELRLRPNVSSVIK
jgi:hypothetical protein